MVYMYHSFLVHSSADGHLGCFHVLAMINSAAMNIGVHVSLSDVDGFLMCFEGGELHALVLHHLDPPPNILFLEVLK